MNFRKAVLPNAVRRYPHQMSALLLARFTRSVGPAIALSWAIVFTTCSHAQSTFGSVRGTVQDETGASIPGALVTVHSTDENADRTRGNHTREDGCTDAVPAELRCARSNHQRVNAQNESK